MDNQYNALLDKYSNKTYDYYDNKRQEMLQYIPENAKRVLDIGCGKGGFGEALKSRYKHMEVWGLEPHIQAATMAKKVLDNLICATFENDTPELSGEKFDVIIFNDVLEHLMEPNTILKRCRNYLTENGIVVASVPNILYYPVFFIEIIVKEDWQYTDEGILDNTHLRFFTKKSLVRMFEESGFNTERIEGINKFVPFHYWIMNFLTLNKLKEWRYRQYAITASLKNNDSLQLK